MAGRHGAVGRQQPRRLQRGARRRRALHVARGHRRVRPKRRARHVANAAGVGVDKDAVRAGEARRLPLGVHAAVIVRRELADVLALPRHKAGRVHDAEAAGRRRRRRRRREHALQHGRVRAQGLARVVHRRLVGPRRQVEEQAAAADGVVHVGHLEFVVRRRVADVRLPRAAKVVAVVCEQRQVRFLRLAPQQPVVHLRLGALQVARRVEHAGQIDGDGQARAAGHQPRVERLRRGRAERNRVEAVRARQRHRRGRRRGDVAVVEHDAAAGRRERGHQALGAARHRPHGRAGQPAAGRDGRRQPGVVRRRQQRDQRGRAAVGQADRSRRQRLLLVRVGERQRQRVAQVERRKRRRRGAKRQRTRARRRSSERTQAHGGKRVAAATATACYNNREQQPG